MFSSSGSLASIMGSVTSEMISATCVTWIGPHLDVGLSGGDTSKVSQHLRGSLIWTENVTHGLNAPLVVMDEGEEFLGEEGN